MHEEIQKSFKDNIVAGIKDLGLIEAIAERPTLNPYFYEPFPDIFSKAASIMEDIVKWHPFIDGNKRTGLVATYTYMNRNGYDMVIPFDAVRFTVLIAKDEKNFDDIREWINQMSANIRKEYNEKAWKYFWKPYFKLFLLAVFRRKKARKMLSEWFAYDIYPEYRVEEQKIIDFIVMLMRKSLETARLRKSANRV